MLTDDDESVYISDNDRGLSFMIDRTFSIVNLCGRIQSNLVTLRLNLQQNSQTPQHRKSVQTEPVEPADVETEPTTEQTCIKPKKFVSAAGLSPLPHCETRTMKLYILNDLVTVPLFWQAAHIWRNCTYDSHKKNSRLENVRKPRESSAFPTNLSKKRESEQVVQHSMLETVVIRTVCTAMKNTQRHVQEKHGWCAMNVTGGHTWSVLGWTKEKLTLNATSVLTDCRRLTRRGPL